MICARLHRDVAVAKRYTRRLRFEGVWYLTVVSLCCVYNDASEPDLKSQNMDQSP